MKHTSTILTSILLLLLLGCGSSTTAPLEADAVRSVILANLAIIEAGFNSEDIFLASQPISDQFTLDNNVATRYGQPWPEADRGPGKFRDYLNFVFQLNANIEFSLVLTDLDLSGDIATAHCSTDYASQRPDVIPPEIQVATTDDFLQFEREGGRWLLRRWEVQPEPVHDEGEGEAL